MAVKLQIWCSQNKTCIVHTRWYRTWFLKIDGWLEAAPWSPGGWEAGACGSRPQRSLRKSGQRHTGKKGLLSTRGKQR